MEPKSLLYTYGNIHIVSTELIHLLRPFQINCVLDCRGPISFRSYWNSSSEELKEALQQQHISYLPFHQHFSVFPIEARDDRGRIVYQKAISTGNIRQGLERIQNGIQKGYRICIIDNQEEAPKSTRFTLIGKYFQESCQVFHIYPNGHYFSHAQVEQLIEEQKKAKREKAHVAQELGKTGEELAALYLTRNGYQILDHNWNLHRGCELDLVAMKDNKLHFIEVKTRTSDRHGDPETAINYQKMKNIRRAIQLYRYKRYAYQIEYQIDSIAIIYRSAQDYDLKHFLCLRVNDACDEVISLSIKPPMSTKKESML